MYLYSISAYADTIIDEIDDESQQALRSLSFDQLASLHSSWGRAIRNEFGLWQFDHPLTKHWHEFPEEHDMRNGVDYSDDHPDAVSMEIMKVVWKKVNA